MADNSDSGAADVNEPKKGRGRPKKTEITKEEPKAEKRGRGRSAAVVSPKKDTREEESEPVVKRGRGRPKGSTKKGRGKPKSPAKQPTTNKSGRGRGRPRKQPVEEEEESKDESDEGSLGSDDEKGDEKK